ncbi:4120_t:CDS:2, partial [Gigaspora rosea]
NEFEEKEISYELLQTQYNSIKGNFQTSIGSTEQTSTSEKENEVSRYKKLQQIAVDQDPLK